MSGNRVVVLLSAYNGEQYIQKQIESIFNQTGLDSLSLIVRNDGSSDKTTEILEALRVKYKDLEIVYGQNIGLVASFLELLNYAYLKGFDYYSFSDQDDYWFPEKLNIAIKALSNKNFPCMYSSCSKIVDENMVESGNLTQTQLKDITLFNTAIQNFCPGHNQVLNRAMAKMIVSKTKYSPAIYSQDMWIAQVASVSGEIVFDNTPHTLYRQHKNNQLSFGKSKIEWAKDHIKRLKKGEGEKIGIQLKYFCSCYGEYLSKEQKEEVNKFFDSQDLFIKRIWYVVRTKMYRQRSIETFIFKLIYILGGYNI